MTTRFTHLVTYWEPDEALSIIAFLDELRYLLWNTYGNEIIKQQQNNRFDPRSNGKQLDLDFDDPF